MSVTPAPPEGLKGLQQQIDAMQRELVSLREKVRGPGASYAAGRRQHRQTRLAITSVDPQAVPTYPVRGTSNTFPIRFIDDHFPLSVGMHLSNASVRTSPQDDYDTFALNITGEWIPSAFVVEVFRYVHPGVDRTQKGEWYISRSFGNQVVRFQLTAALSTVGTSAAAVTVDETGTPDGGTLVVHDTVGVHNGDIGFYGWAVWSHDAQQWEIIFLEAYARWIIATLSQDWPAQADNALASVDRYWGATPNHRNPGAAVQVYDPLGDLELLKNGDKVIAVLDETDPDVGVRGKYKIIRSLKGIKLSSICWDHTLYNSDDEIEKVKHLQFSKESGLQTHQLIADDTVGLVALKKGADYTVLNGVENVTDENPTGEMLQTTTPRIGRLLKLGETETELGGPGGQLWLFDGRDNPYTLLAPGTVQDDSFRYRWPNSLDERTEQTPKVGQNLVIDDIKKETGYTAVQTKWTAPGIDSACSGNQWLAFIFPYGDDVRLWLEAGVITKVETRVGAGNWTPDGDWCTAAGSVTVPDHPDGHHDFCPPP